MPAVPTVNVTFSGSGTLQFASGFSGPLSTNRNFLVDPSVTGTIDTNGQTVLGGGSLILASGATLIKTDSSGVGTFESDALVSLGNNSKLQVNSGTLRLAATSGFPTIGSGVTATVSGGANVGAFRLGLAIEPGGEHRQQQHGRRRPVDHRQRESNRRHGHRHGEHGRQQRRQPVGLSNPPEFADHRQRLDGDARRRRAAARSRNPTGPNNINFSSALTSLNIAGTLNAWTGTLDIGNNGLVIAYGTAANDPYTTIDNMIESGFDGGSLGWHRESPAAWAGAAANSHTPLNIGLEDFTPGTGNFTNTTFIVFEGQTVTTNAILIRLTYMDDIVLAGDLNSQDATSDALLFAANYGTGTTWSVGDLKHTGLVGSADALLFAANYTPSASPRWMARPADAVVLGSAAAAVPEPASMLLAALGAFSLGLLARNGVRRLR